MGPRSRGRRWLGRNTPADSHRGTFRGRAGALRGLLRERGDVRAPAQDWTRRSDGGPRTPDGHRRSEGAAGPGATHPAGPRARNHGDGIDSGPDRG
jgi:hypothetical protein